MATIDEYRASFVELTDDDLLNLHIAVTQERLARERQALVSMGDQFYYNKSPNNWHKLPLNVETMAKMGRNPDGSPKPVKEKKK